MHTWRGFFCLFVSFFFTIIREFPTCIPLSPQSIHHSVATEVISTGQGLRNNLHKLDSLI